MLFSFLNLLFFCKAATHWITELIFFWNNDTRFPFNGNACVIKKVFHWPIMFNMTLTFLREVQILGLVCNVTFSTARLHFCVCATLECSLTVLQFERHYHGLLQYVMRCKCSLLSICSVNTNFPHTIVVKKTSILLWYLMTSLRTRPLFLGSMISL